MDCTSFAAHWGHIEGVKVLFDRGATTDATTGMYWIGTALHCAARQGHIEVVKLLLDRGTTVNATTGVHWTALHCAARVGHIEAVRVLLDRGATIDATTNNGWTALHQAVILGHIEVLKLLLDRGAAVDATTNENWTALHHAASNGHSKAVQVLLDRGTSIDATNNEGRTALHEACASAMEALSSRYFGVVKVLFELERGTGTSTSINVADRSGDTALHCAVRNPSTNTEMIQLLLDNGANTDLKNVDGETALDIARRLGWEHRVTLLTSTAHNTQIAAPVL